MTTHDIPFAIHKKIGVNHPTYAAIGFSQRDSKDEFETAVVNEPSVFEPLKFYCTVKRRTFHINCQRVNKRRNDVIMTSMRSDDVKIGRHFVVMCQLGSCHGHLP